MLHPAHVGDQTRRALENVEALATPQGASLSDFAYLIVYLRDPKDLAEVSAIVRERASASTPILFVEGSVCRPEWLVEIEGLAIVRARDRRFDDFI